MAPPPATSMPPPPPRGSQSPHPFSNVRQGPYRSASPSVAGGTPMRAESPFASATDRPPTFAVGSIITSEQWPAIADNNTLSAFEFVVLARLDVLARVVSSNTEAINVLAGSNTYKQGKDKKSSKAAGPTYAEDEQHAVDVLNSVHRLLCEDVIKSYAADLEKEDAENTTTASKLITGTSGLKMNAQALVFKNRLIAAAPNTNVGDGEKSVEDLLTDLSEESLRLFFQGLVKATLAAKKKAAYTLTDMEKGLLQSMMEQHKGEVLKKFENFLKGGLAAGGLGSKGANATPKAADSQSKKFRTWLQTALTTMDGTQHEILSTIAQISIDGFTAWYMNFVSEQQATGGGGTKKRKGDRDEDDEAAQPESPNKKSRTIASGRRSRTTAQGRASGLSVDGAADESELSEDEDEDETRDDGMEVEMELR
ncbi:hypothetical protein LTR95_008094 [Oleoguttula sp. CCFEE 5521]